MSFSEKEESKEGSQSTANQNLEVRAFAMTPKELLILSASIIYAPTVEETLTPEGAVEAALRIAIRVSAETSNTDVGNWFEKLAKR
jgi:hypothetical protein